MDRRLDENRRRGVVWLAQDEVLGTGRPGEFFGYWEAEVDGPVLEEVEGLRTTDDALSWGRARAPCVLIRLARSGYYSAGDNAPHWDLEVPTWDRAPESRGD